MSCMPTPDSTRDRLPILIGVTGRRRFHPDPQRHAQLLAAARDRLRALFDRLDQLLPDTPKVLLCGAAAGTDLAAAQVVLEQESNEDRYPGWSVVLMLPFELDLFEQDFLEPPFDNDLSYLRELCDGHKRVVVKRMRPLHIAEFDDRQLELEPAERVPRLHLAKPPPPGHAETRAQHHEQFGLWLARYATLLVAVTLGEEAGVYHHHGIGGTDRVVAYRRSAMPDCHAQDVFERSSELLSNSPFEEPDAGHVLCLDPAGTSSPDCKGVPGLQVLRPVQIGTPPAQAATLSEAIESFYEAPMADQPDGTPELDSNGLSERFRAALRLAQAVQAIHERDEGGISGRYSASSEEHPVEFLSRVRDQGPIAKQQDRATDQTRTGQRWRAFLFVLSVGCYETYTELAPHNPLPLVAYGVLLIGIAIIAARVKRSGLQTRAEDFRGLREMMRVQIAWWSAGIDHMVDRVHLRTIDTDLRFIREMGALISIWAILRCRRLSTCRIDPALPIPDVRGNYRRWIDDQADYYSCEAEAQASARKLAEDVFTITFTASLLALGVLLFAAHLAPVTLAPLAARGGGLALSVWLVLALLLIVGVWYEVTGSPFGRNPAAASRIRHWLKTWALALAAGVAAASIAAEAVRRILENPIYAPGLQQAGPVVFLIAAGLLVFVRIPERVRDFKVLELSWGQRIASIFLLTVLVVAGAGAFAPITAGEPEVTAEGVRSLILVQSVLLLGSTGMLRWYSDQRNHVAQAGHYADMARAFQRAQLWIQRYPDADLLPDRSLQEQLVELGELALDENEAWLKAHRNRPAEPIAGS